MDYTSYLQLERLLSAQTLVTGASGGDPAHDEHLFIIVHQAYELWFKQILHEVAYLQRLFNAEALPDEALGLAVQTLNRIVTIQKHLVQQVDILETMTPMSFLEFRDQLRPASGFQSAQFRLIETRLGLPRSQRLKFDERSFDALLDTGSRKAVEMAESDRTLFHGIEAWLARMPFLETRSFDFGKALQDKFVESEERITRQAGLADAEIEAQRAAIARQRHMLKAILDDEIFSYVQPEQGWRMRRPALEAALFICLYHHKPLLQQPYQILKSLMDVDEQMTLWRMRHVMMVARMIGLKVGTGGSSGVGYLRATVDAHRVFNDLFAISTFLAPQSMLPPLPPEMERAMTFQGMPS